MSNKVHLEILQLIKQEKPELYETALQAFADAEFLAFIVREINDREEMLASI